MPPFVMMWAVGCGLAFGEGRPRWLMFAWGAAWLALQLHVSGILLLAVLFILMWVYQLPQGWRYVFAGSGLALLPALPWLYAQVTGAAELGLNLAIPAGRAGFRINFEEIIQFFTARDLAANFISDGRYILASRLAYMRYLAPIWLLLYLGSLLFLVWRYQKVDERQRPLYLLLVLWSVLSLGFTILAEAEYTIVYYLPVLPAPCIALALLWKHLSDRFPRFGLPFAVATLVLCLLNLNAVWIIDQYINDELLKGDTTSHAFSLGTYPPPLVWQLDSAREIHQLLDAGKVSELILVFYVDKYEDSFYLRRPFWHHLRGYDVRVLDIKQTHFLYPERPALFLWNEREPELQGSFMAELQFFQQVGPYHLYQLSGNAGPIPQTLLPERTAYENGLRLIGYDELQCEGNWKLHWTPGPADGDGEPVHFFVHLLNAEGEILAQHDLRTYDVRDWREGDHIVTTLDFGEELRGLSIKDIRVGLYLFSDETNSYLKGVKALDEQGEPREYAVDIPFAGECAA